MIVYEQYINTGEFEGYLRMGNNANFILRFWGLN